MLNHHSLLSQGLVVGGARVSRSSDSVEVVAPLSHVIDASSVLSGLMFGTSVRIRPRLAAPELVHAMARGDITQA